MFPIIKELDIVKFALNTLIVFNKTRHIKFFIEKILVIPENRIHPPLVGELVKKKRKIPLSV